VGVHRAYSSHTYRTHINSSTFRGRYSERNQVKRTVGHLQICSEVNTTSLVSLERKSESRILSQVCTPSYRSSVKTNLASVCEHTPLSDCRWADSGTRGCPVLTATPAFEKGHLETGVSVSTPQQTSIRWPQWCSLRDTPSSLLMMDTNRNA
jgi:hypothetical protein